MMLNSVKTKGNIYFKTAFPKIQLHEEEEDLTSFRFGHSYEICSFESDPVEHST